MKIKLRRRFILQIATWINLLLTWP